MHLGLPVDVFWTIYRATLLIGLERRAAGHSCSVCGRVSCGVMVFVRSVGLAKQIGRVLHVGMMVKVATGMMVLLPE